VRLDADWFVRGGIRTFVTAEHRQRGWKPAPRIDLVPEGLAGVAPSAR
jgi:7-cyano-7-deazaguanine reductase